MKNRGFKVLADASIIVLALLAIGATQESGQESVREATIRAEVRGLIDDLYTEQWLGVELLSLSPTQWIVHLKTPMKRILEIGGPAQSLLLERLSDPLIKDQVMFLLGGIGDERSIGPIIDSMVDPDQTEATPNSDQINFVASFALTNLTTAEVLLPHSGGNLIENCSRKDQKVCWQSWWGNNKTTFSINSVTLNDREYPHYPNYGIYRVSARTGFWRHPDRDEDN